MGVTPGIPGIFPIQRFLLKMFIGETLDDKTADILIRDMFNEKTLETLTETQFLEYLKAEGRIGTCRDAPRA